ncbi:MAG: hypothetical protein ACRDL8_00635, partial [Solirubrobacteraceae bacterium]
IQDWAETQAQPEKRWVALPDACPICVRNAAEGWIRTTAPFDSGDGFPPAHPHCRCSVETR